MPLYSFAKSWTKILKFCALTTIVGSGAASSALALSEANFARDFDALALPLVERTQLKFFQGAGKVRIAYRNVPAAAGVPSLGAVVFVHGYSESMLKHAELIFDLTRAGYQVFALDLRGMGQSERLLPNHQIGHVEHFADYVADLSKFVDEIVVPHSARPLYLLAHSLGSMISAELLAKGGTPFAAAAFSAPMFGIKTQGFPPWMVKTVIGFNLWRGLGQDYRPGAGDYEPAKQDASKSVVTHSIARAQQTLDLYRDHPELVISGQSNRWMAEAIGATYRAPGLARRITVPIKILQAEEDVIVTAEGQQEFCAAAPRCELRVVAGARHEVLQETDALRSPVMDDVLTFFRAKPLVN